MLAIMSELVAVEVHALGVDGRPGALLAGMVTVRTREPAVVYSSTYSGFVFVAVAPME